MSTEIYTNKSCQIYSQGGLQGDNDCNTKTFNTNSSKYKLSRYDNIHVAVLYQHLHATNHCLQDYINKYIYRHILVNF